MNMTRARLLRITGVIGLIAGPISLIVTTVMQWMLQAANPTATVYEVIAQNQAAWLTLGILSVFGPLVWLAGIPAVIDRVPGRGWVLTTSGGLVTAIGLAAGIGHLALFFGTDAVLAADGLGGPARELLDKAAGQEPLGNLLLVVFLAAFSLGPILMTIGLRRAKAVAVWVPVTAIIMTVANFVGGVPAGIVQLAALVATFVPIVVTVLRAPTAAPALAAKSDADGARSGHALRSE